MAISERKGAEMTRKEQMPVGFTQEQREWIRKMAEKQGVSEAEVVRRCVDDVREWVPHEGVASEVFRMSEELIERQRSERMERAAARLLEVAKAGTSL